MACNALALLLADHPDRADAAAELATLRADNERLRERITAARSLHPRGGEGWADWCPICVVPYPCDTARTLGVAP